MAKGIGLIGNFRGKVGNMIGYNLKDSNNKQTQGVRVYQPVVKNPKTYAQAKQRAKLAPINATYRALKAVIDRGQESKAYGNKSRLAWLKDALKAYNGGWFEKSAVITAPALVPLTKGSIAGQMACDVSSDELNYNFDVEASAAPTTVGALATAMTAGSSLLKLGDQVTFVFCGTDSNGIQVNVVSIVLDATDTTTLESLAIEASVSKVTIQTGLTCAAYAAIISRQGDGGEHLRNNTSLVATDSYPSTTQGDAAKEAAIKSYMAAGTTSDWPEEEIQG